MVFVVMIRKSLNKKKKRERKNKLIINPTLKIFYLGQFYAGIKIFRKV